MGEATYVNPFEDLRGRLRVPQLGQRGAARASSRTTASSPRCSSRTRSRRSSRRATSLARPPDARRVRAALGRPAGAQPLAGRLLRRHARPARRAWRRSSSTTSTPRSPRSSGRREQGLLRRHPAPRRAARLGAAAAARARLRADLGGVRRTSTCRSTTTAAPPGPDSGTRPGVDGDVHGRARVVLAPRVLAHGLRRRVRAVTRGSSWCSPSSRRAGCPARSRCSTTSYERFRDPSTAESHFGGEVVEGGDRARRATTGTPTATRARASSGRARAPLRYEIGVDRIMWGQDYPHIEGTYPYTTEALRNTLRRRRRPTRSRAMVGLQRRRRSTASTSTRSRRSPSGSARPSSEVAVPLDEIPADTLSIAFADQELKPW